MASTTSTTRSFLTGVVTALLPRSCEFDSTKRLPSKFHFFEISADKSVGRSCFLTVFPMQFRICWWKFLPPLNFPVKALSRKYIVDILADHSRGRSFGACCCGQKTTSANCFLLRSSFNICFGYWGLVK